LEKIRIHKKLYQLIFKAYNDDGKYVIFGLIDLHVHMMWDESHNPVATLESEGYEQMLIRAVSYCRTYLQNGITTVRDIDLVDDIALHVARSIDRILIDGSHLL